jgi:hypothetical protein
MQRASRPFLPVVEVNITPVMRHVNHVLS